MEEGLFKNNVSLNLKRNITKIILFISILGLNIRFQYPTSEHSKNIETLQDRNYNFLHCELHNFVLYIFPPKFTNIYKN